MVMDKRCAALLVVVCVAARAALAVSDGPLQNGNFECPPDPNQMNGSAVTGQYAIPNWKICGYVEYIQSGQQQGDIVLTVPEGAHAVRLGNEASIEQQMGVTMGMYYSLSFSAARTCGQSQKLRVSVNPGGQTSDLPTQTVYSSNGWDTYSWAFKAACNTVTFVIHNPGQEDDPACGPIVDSVAIKTLYPPQATQNNLLKNGNFEEGPQISQDYQWGVLVPPMDEDDVSPLPGWMIKSFSKVVKYVDSAHFAVPQGRCAVELVSGVETALVQEVDTVPGSSYRLEFSAGDAADGCDSPMEVQAFAAGGRTTVTVFSPGPGGYTRGALEFTATDSRTRVVFVSPGYYMRNDGSGTLCGPVIDDASLVCVSKPTARRLLL
ncbi:hypothetical protein PR202_ga19831 [Eleusine coracana subsp. coracana]|uniref:DUF642 domain-containing protein n=1 Tax=Eleusine coracana subsp. coracana TaxID=191504 RepID=A0AAV5CVL3_ELECO|nr:hypothetical protein QOZ80_4AG0312370 [Eleusine coracana subsp. coracana]GJN02477.1 hypothetical protein PR202_ga19831 [Eleusine coracana subsp. coracana]